MSFFNKYKKIHLVLFFLFLITLFNKSIVMGFNPSDKISVEWDNRLDVREAGNLLKEADAKLQQFIPKIYNAYARYTVGEGEKMRKRMKTLLRLINAGEKVDSICIQYILNIGENKPYAQKMSQIKNEFYFYYFDQELKLHIPWINSTITSELNDVFQALCDPTWHPGFVKATKFDKEEAMRLIKQVEEAIHAAVATIPGGSKILQYK